MSSISSQPKGCECDVYPFMLTMSIGESWSVGMDSHGFASGGGCDCRECLCACFPITIALDIGSLPFITPVWLVKKLIKRCKKGENSGENVVVNA